MNLLDLLIILIAAAAAYGGYRLGFLARIFSWAGLAVGALVADRFLPDVVGFFSSSDPQIRLIAAISFLERGHQRFVADAETERVELTPCTVCGSPTTGEVCAFCRMSERAARARGDA